MNDSSKRLRDHAQREADEWEPTTYTEDSKKHPERKRFSVSKKEFALPQSPSDLNDWGCAICGLPKVQESSDLLTKS